MRLSHARIATTITVLGLFGIALPLPGRALIPQYEPVRPTLQVEIPTLKFSDTIVQRTDGTPTEVSIPWIGEYLAAIYRFAVPVGAILATIIIMIGGVIWLTSGGANRLSTAKEWIGNAVIGLVLLVGSYVILNLVNPDLVRFRALQVRIVAPDEITEESEDEAVTGSDPTDITQARSNNIIGQRPVSASMLPALQAAADALEDQDIALLITSGYRSEQSQRDQIADNCQNPPGSSTCNPKPGKAVACMLRNGPKSCPHTTGRAVDAWGWQDGHQCIRKDACVKDKDACRALPCQAAVIAAMRAQGFCNLASEPWHFEKPKMSSNCS